MSFKTNQNQQLTLTDSFLKQTPRTQKMIMNSWSKAFSDIVFPAINEERFAVLYSDNEASRPNTPINFIIGALMLKESNNLSDDETAESICCDVRYQFALHTTHLEEQPISDRTFSRFRERVYNYELKTGVNLLEEEMNHLAKVFSDYMNLQSNIKRMDSLMIASRCKRMSRLEIIYTTVANAVRLLHRVGADDLIGESLRHYLDQEDYNQVIYYCKGEDTASKLDRVIKDAAYVKQLMSDDAWCEFSEYQLLLRVLDEQTKEDKTGEVIAKKSNEITSHSLQNPSDPDATFRKKAGKSYKGYVGNLIETIGENGDSIITGAGYEQNIYSDSKFCKDYLDNRPDGSDSEILITDGAYGGKDNQKLAESKNTTLITTALTGKAPDTIYADFTFSQDSTQVVSCPAGKTPIKTTYYPKTGMCRALFHLRHCANCPNKELCSAKKQKKSYVIFVSANMANRASYLKQLSTEEYIELTRKRNAIEGIPSVLRRKYRIDEIPVYGILRSKQFFWLKIGAYNFKKVIRHIRTREKYAQNLEIA